MSVSHVVKFVILLVLAIASSTATASSTGTTFNVTTEVQSSCQVSATDLTFGVYDPGTLLERTSSSVITVVCTLATPYTIGLNSGSHPSGNNRRMGAGGARVIYGLYRDALRMNVFGTAADMLGMSGVGSGAAQVFTVYGAIPASQNVAAGTYSDQVTVTLDY